MMQPIKPATTIAQQIRLLTDRGMTVDERQASQWLSQVHYYRLSGYWYPYRRPIDAVTRADEFLPNTDFASVAALYEFDRKLRSLVLDGLERVEVALRSQISQILGLRGPLAHRSPQESRPTFQHGAWVQKAGQRVQRASRNSSFVQHHLAKYGPSLPIWVLVEVLDFSDLSILFEGLRTRDQYTVAAGMGLDVDLTRLSKRQARSAKKEHPLVRWLQQLSIVRNVCAHHARLWNMSFVPASGTALRSVPGLGSLPQQSERVYGALLLTGFLLQTISPGTSWPHKLRGLVDESFLPIEYRTVGEMGFPDDWRREALWEAPAPASPITIRSHPRRNSHE